MKGKKNEADGKKRVENIFPTLKTRQVLKKNEVHHHFVQSRKFDMEVVEREKKTREPLKEKRKKGLKEHLERVLLTRLSPYYFNADVTFFYGVFVFWAIISAKEKKILYFRERTFQAT